MLHMPIFRNDSANVASLKMLVKGTPICRWRQATPAFVDALPGYLFPDQASQARISILLERLKKIAAV
jgi:hypothetical protein